MERPSRDLATRFSGNYVVISYSQLRKPQLAEYIAKPKSTFLDANTQSTIYLFSCHGTNRYSYAETQHSFLLIAMQAISKVCLSVEECPLTAPV